MLLEMANEPVQRPATTRTLLAGDLIYARQAVAASTLVRDVAALFRAQPECEAIAVVEDGLPVGLVVGHKLTAALSQQYGFSLYAHRPITKLANANPLIVRAHEPLSDVVDQVLAREKSTVFDDAIVVSPEGLFLGLLSVRSAMIEQNTAFATAVAERQLAHERAAELERIGRMKSQFIAHVTHELRAPVNVMIGVLDLLSRELAVAGNAKTQELLAIASSSGAGLRRHN